MFVAISQSIYPSSFVVQDSVNFMLNCFLGGLGYVFGPMLGTLLLYFGWDLLSVAREFQLLIYSGAMIALMLVLPNGVLSLMDRKEGGEMTTPILEIKGVTKRYGGLTAVNNVSFDVAEGEILSVIGPNGAGKSTLFKLISSFVPATSGEVLFKGTRISSLAPHKVARMGVVRTFQETTIFRSMTRARERHRRAPPALEGEPAGLLPRHRAPPARTRRTSPARPTRSSTSSASARSGTSWPRTCRRGICARSAWRSGSPPIPTVLLLDEPFAGMNHDETMRMVDLVRRLRDDAA